MKRRKFVKLVGLSSFAVSASGFSLIESDAGFTTDCPTSTDILGPFYRRNAPLRNDLSYEGLQDDIPLKVIGQIFGEDCTSPMKAVELDIWHCDHNLEYDMDSPEYRCRAKVITNENGFYWFKTFVPPPYGKRPKHIHYLVDKVPGYQKLITQLYFKGDDRIKKENWIKYPWDQKRILEIYKNEEGLAEVRLDLYLTPRGRT